MADPVSWLLIEPGWRVRDADGNDVGRVEAVTGDSDADIFDGLAIAAGALARPRYVPAEQVGAIENGVVHLALSNAAVDALPEYKEPAEQIDIDPEKASPLARTDQAVRDQDPQEHREGLIRRVAAWFGLAGRR
jgi:hypothetical protein